MMRADAARNREKILAAAQAVFADKGVSASTEDVARAAGVGIGTVFRHFPTKESLVEAVFAALMQGFVVEAAALADAADPGEALLSFLTTLVQVSATKNAYVDALAAAGVDVHEVLGEGRRALPDALATLLGRAQEAGAVRGDLSVQELIALVVGVSRAGGHAPKALQVVWDGMRG